MTGRTRSLAVLAASILMTVAMADEAAAACNAIPVVARDYPSFDTTTNVYSGSLRERIVAPGNTVHVRLDPQCMPPPPGKFNQTAAANVVTVTFEPPSGLNTPVPIDPSTVIVKECDEYGECGPCSATACNTLQFAMPNANALLNDYGLVLTGPARVKVVEAPPGSGTIAEVAKLYQPGSCGNMNPPKDEMFEQFTVLPEPNRITQLEAADAELRMTVDGKGNLLVPLWHDNLTGGGPAAVQRGTGDFSAFGWPCYVPFVTSIAQVLATAPKNDTVLIFTIDGRRIYPLLRIDKEGGIFGLADDEHSVLRVKRNKGGGGTNLDLGHRMQNGRGPIKYPRKECVGLKQNWQMPKMANQTPCNDFVPLDGLREDEDVIAYAGPPSSTGDRGVDLINVATGAQQCSTSTTKTVTVVTAPVAEPALETGGARAAFLDKDANNAVRVYEADGRMVSPPLIEGGKRGSALPRVNGHALAVEPMGTGGDAIVYFSKASSPDELWAFKTSFGKALDSVKAAVLGPRAVAIASNGSLWAYHHGPPPTVTPLELAPGTATTGNKVAIGAKVGAATVPQGTSPGEPVLWEWPVGASSPSTPSLAEQSGTVADYIVVPECEGTSCDAWVAFTTAETDANEDLNYDGPLNDKVLQIYGGVPGSFSLINTKMPAQDLLAGNDLVAFLSDEAKQDPTGADRNLDGDTCDLVLHLVDFTKKPPKVLNVGQTALGRDDATWTEIGWRTPYKILGRNVFFLTQECKEGGTVTAGCPSTCCTPGCSAGGTDLNRDRNVGNGTDPDIVLQVFNADSMKIQQLAPIKAGVPVLVDLIDGEVSLRTQGESSIVVGDLDGDGTFDELDLCVTGSNRGQVDSDLDGLGDAIGDEGCDPTYCTNYLPPTPPRFSGSALTCAQTVGAAALRHLAVRADEMKQCLKRFAEKDFKGDPAVLCRGFFVGRVENRPSDVSDIRLSNAAGMLKEVLKPCHDSLPLGEDELVVDLERRIVRAHGEAIIAASRVALGDAAETGDLQAIPKECTESVFAASLNYLGSIAAAMHACLATVGGQPAEVGDDLARLCFGRIEDGEIVLPVEGIAAAVFQEARRDLNRTIQSSCGARPLSGLNACAADVPGLQTCLVCTNWRRAVEAVHSIYGPIGPRRRPLLVN